MTNSISNLNTIQTTALHGNAAGAKPETVDGSFKEVLLQSIDEVNSLQRDANRAVEQLATGGDTSPAEVLTAVQKADMAFRMMLQVRNKLIQAYQEVQNIRV